MGIQANVEINDKPQEGLVLMKRLPWIGEQWARFLTHYCASE